MAAAAPTSKPAAPAPKPGQIGGGSHATVTIKHSAPTVHAAAAGVRAAAAGAVRGTRPAARPSSSKPAKPNTPLQSATFADPYQTIMQGGTPSTQDVNAYVNQTVGNQTQAGLNADLGPLRTQAGTIRNEQQTALNRWNAYTGVAQGQIGDQITAQQKGAASLQNLAAQGAQQTAGLFNAQGQTAANLFGGALSPTAQALLNSGRAYAGGLAGNEQQFIGAGNTATQNFLRSMADVATAEGMRGKQDIRSTYGKQLTQNQAAQQSLIASAAAKAPSLKSDLRQQLFSDWATAQIGKIRAQTANQQGQNYRATQAWRAKQLSEKTTNDWLTQHGRALDRQIKSGHYSKQEQHWLRQDQLAQQRINNANKPGSKATPGQKLANQIGGQLAYYNSLVNVRHPQKNPNYDKNATSGPTSQKYVNQAYPTSTAKLVVSKNMKDSGVGLDALQQLINWGYINNITLNRLRAQGVPIDPSWTSRQISSLYGGRGGAGGVAGTAAAGR